MIFPWMSSSIRGVSVGSRAATFILSPPPIARIHLNVHRAEQWTGGRFGPVYAGVALSVTDGRSQLCSPVTSFLGSRRRWYTPCSHVTLCDNLDRCFCSQYARFLVSCPPNLLPIFGLSGTGTD